MRRALATPQQSARTIGEWTAALGDIPAALPATGWDAARAVHRYYSQHAGDRSAQFRSVEPHDLLAAWAPHRAEVMSRHSDPVPAADPDNPAAWSRELRESRAAVACGHAAPAQYRAEIDPAGQKRLAALMSGVGNGPRTYLPAQVARDLAPFRPGRAHREAVVAEGLPDPLTVRCPHCAAGRAQPCRGSYRPRGKGRRELPGVHPSRIEIAVTQSPTQEEQTEAERVRLARLMCQPPAPRQARARHTAGGGSR